MATINLKSMKLIFICILTFLIFSVFLNSVFSKNIKEIKEHSGEIYMSVINQAIYNLEHTSIQDEFEETIHTYSEIEVLLNFLPGNTRVFTQAILHEQITDLLTLKENNYNNYLYDRIKKRENFLIESLKNLKKLTNEDPITTFDELYESDSSSNNYMLSRLNIWLQKYIK